ncbi:MAG: FMN-binding negative transcriptional regulator [Solirubrobacteraceae bacterium]
MYLPTQFQADEQQTRDLLDGVTVADLITPTTAGLFATFLPLIYQPAPEGAGWGSLRGHLARNNDHWKLEPNGDSLVLVHGPDAYISPGWYPSKREHGRVVPTWNYLIAQVRGQLVIHHDPAWLKQTVRLLTDRHEAVQEHPWSVDDAPGQFIEDQLRGIIGVELRIVSVQAKAKLGQNRTDADIDGAIVGMQRAGLGDVALAMARANGRVS